MMVGDTGTQNIPAGPPYKYTPHIYVYQPEIVQHWKKAQNWMGKPQYVVDQKSGKPGVYYP